MRDFVERYIHAVTKRLPETSRQDVSQELNSLIYNMLPTDPTESQIEEVLVSLGSPMSLAYQYQDEKRYLISPPFFHDYINILKIVGIIIVSIQILTGTIDSIFNLESTTLWSLIGEVLNNVLGGLLGNLSIGFTIVTIAFWAYEYGVQKGEVQWVMKDLPEVPQPKTQKINRFEASVELIFHVVFSIIAINLFVANFDLLQFTTASGEQIPIFSASVVNRFIPYLIAAAIIGFISILIKLYVGQWRYAVTSLHTIYEVASSLLIILFIQNRNLIQVEAFQFIADTMNTSLETLRQNVTYGINVLTVIIILVVLIDIGFSWKKTIEGYRNPSKK